MNLRTYAKGRDCDIRLPGICNFDPATSVWAHLPGGGMGTKKPDILGCVACSACHDEVDRRTHLTDFDYARRSHMEAILRRQEVLVGEGVLSW